MQCSKQTETAQPTPTQKVRNNKSGSNGVLIARDVNGTPQFTYTQQQMKDAIVSAYLSTENVVATVTEDIALLSETNPSNGQVGYGIGFPVTLSSGLYDYIIIDIDYNNGDYNTMPTASRCQSGLCNSCRRFLFFPCGCRGDNSSTVEESCRNVRVKSLSDAILNNLSN